MQAKVEVQRALGKYRAPWLTLILQTLTGVVFVGVGLTTKSSLAAVIWIGTGIAFVGIAWLVPATIINQQGIRMVHQFKFIHWVDVITVFQPGPGDPDTMIQLRGGKRIVLAGVGRDSLPGIVLLARNSGITGTDAEPPHS